jgi:hypothetical protein
MRIITDNPLEDISSFNNFVKNNNITISNFNLKETTLEEVFIHIIKTDSQSNRRDSK